MDNDKRLQQNGEGLGPETFLQAPLRAMTAQLVQEREICVMIETIASSDGRAPTDIGRVLDFLRHDLPLQLQDEAQSLLPMLRKRCKPDDDIDKAIARLTADLEHAKAKTPQVIAVLEGLLTSPKPADDDARLVLADFAAQARRHLALENAVAMPLARLRLTRKDRTEMGEAMAQRRGYSKPLEP